MGQIDRRAFLKYMGASLVLSACGGPDVTTQLNSGNPDLVDATPAAAPTESAHPEFTNPAICTYVKREAPCALDFFATGAKPYLDRDRHIVEISPGLQYLVGTWSLLPTFNDDKKEVGGYPQVQALITTTTTFYVALDKRIQDLPSWIQSFDLTEESIVTDDEDMPFGYAVYSYTVEVSDGMTRLVLFGGNLDPESKIAQDEAEQSISNFFVLVAHN